MADFTPDGVMYEDFFHNAPDMFLSIDAKTTKILACNKILQKKTGYTQEELIGKNIFHIHHPSSHKPLKKVLKSLKQKNEIECIELQVRSKDKGIIDVMLNVTSVCDVNDNAIRYRVVLRDILSFKQRRDEKFRLMANSAPVMIWMSAPDKLCNFFNHGWLEFTGKTMEQELGNGWAEGVHSDDLDRCLQTYTSAFDDRKPFKMEYRLRRYDGEYRWVLDHGVPMFEDDGRFSGYIGSCIDITERKNSEEKLKLFRDLINESNDAIYVLNPKTAQIIYVNNKACSSLGYKKEDLLKKRILDIEVMLSDESAWKNHVKEVKKSGSLLVIGTHKRKDKRLFTVEINIKYISRAKNDYMLAMVRDITEREKIQTRLSLSEKCFRQVVELSPYVIAIHDGKKVVFVNNAGLKLLGGQDYHDIVGKSIFDFVQPDHKTKVIERIKVALKEEEKTPIGEIKLRTLNGEIVDVETISGPIHFRGKKCVQVVAHDVSELKRTTINLDKKSIALNEVVNQIEEAKKRLEDEVMSNVENIILPILEKRTTKGLQNKYVDLLEKHLNEIISPYGKKITSRHYALTTREIEICNLVKHGHENKEIANFLNLSVYTIHNHRINIRKKLKLKKRENLVDFLRRL